MQTVLIPIRPRPLERVAVVCRVELRLADAFAHLQSHRAGRAAHAVHHDVIIRPVGGGEEQPAVLPVITAVVVADQLRWVMVWIVVPSIDRRHGVEIAALGADQRRLGARRGVKHPHRMARRHAATDRLVRRGGRAVGGEQQRHAMEDRRGRRTERGLHCVRQVLPLVRRLLAEDRRRAFERKAHLQMSLHAGRHAERVRDDHMIQTHLGPLDVGPQEGLVGRVQDGDVVLIPLIVTRQRAGVGRCECRAGENPHDAAGQIANVRRIAKRTGGHAAGDAVKQPVVDRHPVGTHVSGRRIADAQLRGGGASGARIVHERDAVGLADGLKPPLMRERRRAGGIHLEMNRPTVGHRDILRLAANVRIGNVQIHIGTLREGRNDAVHQHIDRRVVVGELHVGQRQG